MDELEKFARVVKKGIFYSADCDDRGARVSTNLENTLCPHCKSVVQPDVEHLCGNRLPRPKRRGGA